MSADGSSGMAAKRAALLLDTKCTLGEGATWCARTGRFYWTDIEGARLWRHDPSDGRSTYWRMPERLATFALCSLGPGGVGWPAASAYGWLALAWLLGYVMPGAPAGVGVRETVLVIGLGPALGEADALVVALAYRFVTVLVDAVSGGVGFLLRDRA